MAKLKIGNTVRLNSGGPLMTVKEYAKAQPQDEASDTSESEDQVVCIWYNNDKNALVRKTFHHDMLYETNE